MLTTRSRAMTAARQFWGEPDTFRQLVPGVWATSTPGHGGLVVSTEMFPLPDWMVGLDGNVARWTNSLTGETVLTFAGFEEDCSWAVLLHHYPDLLAHAIRVRWLAEGVTHEDVANRVKWDHPALFKAQG